MSRSCSITQVILLSLVLFFGSLFITMGPFLYPSYPRGSPYQQTLDYSFTLSSEQPRYDIQNEPWIIEAEIISLATNGSTVLIEAIDFYNNTIASISGVRQVQNDGLVIEGRSFGWNLSIVREYADAEVTLTIEVLNSPPMIDTLMTAPIPIFFVGIIFLAIGIQGLNKFDKSCSGFMKEALPPTRKRWKAHQGPALVLILVLLSGAMCAPLVRGTITGDFTLYSHTEYVDGDTLSIAISLVHPTAIINLSSYFPSDVDGLSMELSNMEVTGSTVSMNLTLGDTMSIWVVNGTLAGDLTMHIDSDIDKERLLIIERVTGSSTVDLSIRVEREYLAPRNDPTLHLILSGLAIVPFCIAFWRIFWIRSKLSE